MIYFKRCYQSLSPLPARANQGDAGFDICNADDFKIYPGDTMLIPTGWACSFPPDMYLRVAPRSSLAVKHSINILAGVIDSGYRGEITVVMHRCSENQNRPVFFEAGSKIAQLIPTALAQYDAIEISDFTDIQAVPDRNGGFGSTGIKAKDIGFN